jgi:hypothetical protein
VTLSKLLRSDKAPDPICNRFPMLEVPETVNWASARSVDTYVHA